MFKNYKVVKEIINKQVCDIAVEYCELTKTKAKYLLDNNLIPFGSARSKPYGLSYSADSSFCLSLYLLSQQVLLKL